MRLRLAILAVVLPVVNSGCVVDPSLSGGGDGAAIVGRIVSPDGSSKLMSLMQGSDCPEVEVTLNGVGVTIVFDDDCSFLIRDIEPAELLELRVELPELNVAGTAEIGDVIDGELIEIEVAVSDESLSIGIVRRVEPGPPGGDLPGVVTENNVSIKIDEGVYEQDLTVLGNNFTLAGEAGEDCDDDGWSVIDGHVQVNGNNATFRNIAFEGSLEVRGNNAKFINCCFNGQLIVFGNNVGIE